MAIEQTIQSEGAKKAVPRQNRHPIQAATEFVVSGMTCGNCARHVTEAAQGVAGVRSVTVDLDAGQAQVHWEINAKPNPEAVVQAVAAKGFGAKVAEPQSSDPAEHKLAGWHLNLWIGVLGTLPLMLGEWVFGWSMAPWFRWASFALASVVQLFAGARFYRGAWNQLKAGNSNMDTLVALGSTTAFGYSAWALLSGQPGHLYFMEAAAIITLISVGHWMESRVSTRASSALRKLLNLAPALARRLDSGGAEIQVPVAELEIGDLIALRPGDSVPTDGVAAQGNSVADESMLTGESTPVDKTVGSVLYSGTVNLSGRLAMRVTATGHETALARIIAAVQRAQTSRAHIQRLGDRVSSVFVPLVTMLAVAAGLWWGLVPESARQAHAWLSQFLWLTPPMSSPLATALIVASAVLIIACPCAMGLATPTAIMAGSNAAAQRGILIRDGVALEKAGRVSAVLFDKTGTLTFGKPAVAKVWEAQSLNSTPRVLTTGEANGLETTRLAAGLARHSTHPISQAVARLSDDGVEVAEWKEVAGAGAQARVVIRRPKSEPTPDYPTHGSRLPASGRIGEPPTEGLAQGVARLGSLRWLRESGVQVEPGKQFVEEWSGRGASIVGVALENELLGLFAVADTLKPGTSAVVRQLGRQGLKVWLVTGDNPLTAASIARQAGIDPQRVFAEVRPEQKAELVRKLQQQGERVAFVGDGINDAAALEQADLGIAVSRASDIAREAADIILLKSEIEAVPESLGLARATLRTIKQNLFWAFFYNAIGIPLAALGFMSPILCAAAMGLSDLVVIGNALRLRRWRLKVS
jgi:Cu+-exporting ATPase